MLNVADNFARLNHGDITKCFAAFAQKCDASTESKAALRYAEIRRLRSQCEVGVALGHEYALSTILVATEPNRLSGVRR